ncbi:hypothetical protein [Comamonas jiangduensis]|uniref:hypothetical protein n=1 Tax=Comamonas jiangduensis TaxID=1194168 RepID=UPI003BF87D54
MHAKPGFIWTFEHLSKDGHVVDVQHNLMPLEGLNHWIDVLLGKTPQQAQWHIGLFSGDYTPVPGDTALTFPVQATEFTAYEGAGRKPFVVASASGGEAHNHAAPAEFTFTANGTIYGGFISSASGKGATSGVLLSAVRFAVPKTKEPTDVLRVKAVLGLISD